MAGGGFIGTMIASLKANKRNRVSTFDKIKDLKKSKKSELFFPKKATKKDLKLIAKNIKEQNNIRFYKNIILLILCIIIALYLIQTSA